MKKLARQCLHSVAILAIGLSLGTTVRAQARAAKRLARRARAAATQKVAPKAKPKSRPKPLSASAARPAVKPAAYKPMDLEGKRDPFVALVNTSKSTAGPRLPAGEAGLEISTLTVQGTVQGANGMIAVIANPDQRVYFVRQGDRLYDGVVEKITLDGVTFQQNTKDAFGRPIERTVVKRIYPSAGEQQ